MSMVSTLAKVAAGALVARGMGKMMQGGGGAGGGLGGMLGGALGGGQQAGGGLGGMLGGMLGGQQGNAQQGGQGGLGGMLGGMLGGQGGQAGAGGLGGLLGGAAGGGGLGGLLESLGGQGAQQTPQQPQAPAPGGLGSVLNSAFDKFGEPDTPPTPSQEEQAQLFLRAMISAAKSDGSIDAGEKEKILGQLGDVTQEEINFVQAELAAPLDLESLVRDVPAGMEQQVYLMSLMGIDLDSPAEAQYLDGLAKAMNITPETANAIHDKLGAPKLYS